MTSILYFVSGCFIGFIAGIAVLALLIMVRDEYDFDDELIKTNRAKNDKIF